MRPDAESPDAVPERRHRRGVRLFVALHLGAVGAIYAVALVVGGGFTGPPMPPLPLAVAKPQPIAASPAPMVAVTGAQTAVPTPLPAWTGRAEIAAPWEPR